MKSLAQATKLFKESVVGGTINAPDNYPEWDKGGYATHKAELLSLWSEIRPQLTADLDRAQQIDEHLQAALSCFDRGERESGQSRMFKIYNLLEQGRLR
jgi:hypothetical protein